MKMRNFNGIPLNGIPLPTERFIEFSESEPFEIVDSFVDQIICCLESING